ncbi:MAG: alanine--tRNA ligase [Planctomycetes bacterium]|nr:alanine--tRNA ligase [Planctomycetota bacterium]
MNSAAIRSTYLEFFRARGHALLPSASLVPDDDPTLLFTGAGMNQFKDMFLGRGTLPHKRVTTTQKCVRLPDLDNVGRTPSHHTFFEMLGNFSFGDYFKREAIEWADELLRTGYGIDRDRLGITVYQDDDEAAAIWKKLGYQRIWRFGEKDNYWPSEAPSKGPNGPCGPCSEIYFDWGQRADGSPGTTDDPSSSGGRFLEIWNLVFTSYDRRDGGLLEPLPQRNIDTGMGFERIVRVLQGKPTNFETDLFLPILERLGALASRPYGVDRALDRPMRRIADHLRATVFAIADGVVPSNERQGYVVRKIMRRALADGLDALGMKGPFLADLAPAVIGVPGMAECFPELKRHEAKIVAVIGEEERKFLETYSKGREKLGEEVAKVRAAGSATLPGKVAFFLWDTAGFPVDLTQRVLEDEGLALDVAGFEAAMEEQRARSRAGSTMKGDIFAGGPLKELKRELAPTQFSGYAQDARVAPLRVLLRDGARVKTATEGQSVALLFETTPFYAEGGGQVGDRGEFVSDSFRVRIFDTTKADGYFLHHGTVTSGSVSEGQEGRLEVDLATHRGPTRRNHTATHLLHWALRRVLGPSVEQRGSLVDPERLRFDFSWQGAVAPEKLRAVERLVNEQVVANLAVGTQECAYDAAVKAGAMALFGEKYGDLVRVVAVEDSVADRRSVELCGGTHVQRTGDIGSLKIVAESGIAAGVRRVEAVTGLRAIELFQAREELVRGVAAQLRTTLEELPVRVTALQEDVKRLKKELEKASRAQSSGALDDLLASAESIGGVRVVVAALDLAGDPLLALVDQLKAKLVGGCIAVVGKEGEKAPIVVAVDQEAQSKGLKAGELCKVFAGALGGGGGGNPTLARGQGKAGQPVAAGLEAVRAAIRAATGG